MDHANLITDLTLIMILAGLMTWISRSLKQPAILGYIVVGILLSPHTPGPFVVDLPNIKIWSELGVILLMFSLGLEFSPRSLMTAGPTSVIIGSIGILGMGAIALTVNSILGWPESAGWFVAAMMAISSTTIIVKIFSERGWTNHRFARTVITMMVVEDFVAILAIVALNSFGQQSNVDLSSLFFALIKLMTVVIGWFIGGIFLIPRLIRRVGQHNSNELIVISAVALCLGMVWVAQKFEYSPALGAFIVGSILAETREVRRIEGLINPIRDMFAAVFFVYIGMLFDPSAVMTEWKAVLIITAAIMIGKPLSVFVGSLLVGQPIQQCFRIALSMPHIGEFSFVIAALGLSLGVIEPKILPIMISASVLTSFISPFLMTRSETIGRWFESRLPNLLVQLYTNHRTWTEKRFSNMAEASKIYAQLGRWLISFIIVLALFQAARILLLPLLYEFWPQETWIASLVGWLTVLSFSSPFIWSMLHLQLVDRTEGRSKRITVEGALSGIAAIAVLSQDFIGWSITSVGAFALIAAVIYLSRKRLETHYRWYEELFLAGIEPQNSRTESATPTKNILAPWDTVLSRVVVGLGAKIAGKSVANLNLREKFGINIVAIERIDKVILPPLPSDIIMPGDELLVFGSDESVIEFEKITTAGEKPAAAVATSEIENYRTSTLTLKPTSPWCEKTIRESAFREEYHCIVVGIERNGQRIRSPQSDMRLQSGDVLWLVGETHTLAKLSQSS
jgi:CPA2 family monovalent cation:H+ antiporter-2